MNPELKENYITIHRALHSSIGFVVVNMKMLPIETSSNGQRYVRWNSSTFITQDPRMAGKYAAAQKAGSKVTRVMRAKNWGLIINSEIIKE